MKKKILIFSAFIIGTLCTFSVLGNFTSFNFSNLGVISTASASSVAPNKKVHKDNCQIVLRGVAYSTISFLGVSHTFPVSGTISLTFYDVQRDCESGGTFDCVDQTCADFWRGGGPPSTEPPIPPLP